MTSTVSAGSQASISIKGAPNTNYTISVRYSSGISKANGLESKVSDDNGNVSWSWKIGNKTKKGTYPITISGGDSSVNTEFTIQ